MVTNITTYKLITDLILLENNFNEGLIMTHDIHDSKNALEYFFDLDTQLISLNIDNNKMILSITEFNINKFTEFLILITNLGYFVSKMKIYNQYNIPININLTDFKNKYLDNSILKNITKYDIILEPKFDIKHQLKTTILYHVTEEKYLNKILKNGLIAKSKNTLSEYPERIYFVYNIDDAKQYINNKQFYYLRNYNKMKQPDKSKYIQINYIILQIKLLINNNIVFFEDPNFKGKGIYTYNNISPENISIINE